MSSHCPFDLCDGSGFRYDEQERTAYDCRCRAQRQNAARSRSLSGVIPRRYRGVSFDRPPVVDIDPTLVREVRRYAESVDVQLDGGRGMWFIGDPGTGKTTLAMLLSKTALAAGRSVAIYSMPRLLAELRRTYDTTATRTDVELIDRLAAVDLLHIDDLGAEKSSEWALEQLYSIVNARYEDERAIVATTNLSELSELRDQIGARTVSRLIEICGDPLMLFGPDHRIKVRSA